jgi:hypothetical protein
MYYMVKISPTENHIQTAELHPFDAWKMSMRPQHNM